MAAAEAAINGPPPFYPATHGGQFPAQPQRGVANSVPQEPGAAVPPQPAVTRPVFYLPTHPPPPLLHYQWPMPFSYNPFAGFPGMGYGMVMPQFPPPPFMEAPPYILPHSHVQPVDFRRYSNALGGPHQNPISARRGPTPAGAISVRATVSTEVQTEPIQRAEGGYAEACTDSGHGTASSSLSSSSSGSQKRDSAGHCASSQATISRDDQPCTGSAVQQSATGVQNSGEDGIPSCSKTTHETQTTTGGSVKELPVIGAFQSGHFHVWSESSPDSMTPVCTSSQADDEVIRERRISVPDILMLQMAEKPWPGNDRRVPNANADEQHDRSVQSSSESNSGKVSAVGSDEESISASNDKEFHATPAPLLTPLEELSKSKRETLELGSSVRCHLVYRDELQNLLNATQNPPESEQEKSSVHDDTADVAPLYMSSSSFQMRRKLNESVWSVESLEPFIPNREWLLQNGIFEAGVIIETEEANNGSPNLNGKLFVLQQESGQTQRCSSSNAVHVSDSLVFSTPNKRQESPKKPRMESKSVPETSAAEDGQAIPDKNALTPAKAPLSETVGMLTENLEEGVVSEEAPNQETSCVMEQTQQSPESPQEETSPLSAEAQKVLATVNQSLQNLPNGDDAEGKELGVVSQQTREVELRVPAAAPELAEVSPFRGVSVDTGIQCSDLCSCDQLKNCKGPVQVHLPKIPDIRKANYETEQSCMDGRQPKYSKRANSGRNRNQERYSIQHEVYGYGGKSGRFKGGNGRNPHY